MTFTCNMSALDRLFRASLGCGLVYLGFIAPELISIAFVNWMLGLVGVVNILVALAGHCPLYHLANVSTCRAVTDDVAS